MSEVKRIKMEWSNEWRRMNQRRGQQSVEEDEE